MPQLPKTAWIPQIEVSAKNAGEAFVVVNNYRQNDWSAYLYHTTDYGMTWRRLVDDNDVSSFVTSVVQDQKEPNLLFLGTDAGLYISFDKGGKWHKWNNGLPSVQIRDMKIQSTFDDLVLGTFGRAFWVLDDISTILELCSAGKGIALLPQHIIETKTVINKGALYTAYRTNISMSPPKIIPLEASVCKNELWA